MIEPFQSKLGTSLNESVNLVEVDLHIRCLVDPSEFQESKYDPERFLNDYVEPTFKELWREHVEKL